jgi:subtilisin family serine protease
MTDVICPNCHSVTAPFRYCLDCNAPLEGLDEICADQSPPKTSFTARLLAAPTRNRGKNTAVQMDGHLRRVCRRVLSPGFHKLPTSSAKKDEIAVIAKVTDLPDCPGHNGLKEFTNRVPNVGTTIKDPDHSGTTLVTARVRADELEIEALRGLPFVKSLKAARRIRPHLERTKEVISASGSARSHFESRGTGKGVIVGIVDFGLDLLHKNFQDGKGHTRILALWDQKAPGGKHSPKPFHYGRLYEREEINDALKKRDPYKALGYQVPKEGLSGAGAHGTYVADVAAGNGMGSGCSGVAPDADIIFVDLSTAGVLAQARQSVGATFGDSVQLLEAVKFIFDRAGDRPCVVNVSLGTNSGPHDGSTPVEEAIDWLVRERPNRAVVMAAGNSFGAGLHASGRVPPGGSIDLAWRIPRFDSTGNELEIWYNGEDRFPIDIIDPDGNRVAHVRPGQTWEKDRRSKGLMTVVSRLCDPTNSDNSITVFFERSVRHGLWTLRLYGQQAKGGRFHAWIERDVRGQSRFVKSKSNSYLVEDQYTLSSIACGHRSIAVSSYDATDPDLPLAESSSSGPTRDQRDPRQQQPTISAPGEKVLAARAGTMVLRGRECGTSISAAVVAGVVALMLAAAHALGDHLSADEIREILMRTAHKGPPGSGQWDPGSGFGRVDANKAIEEVQNRARDSQNLAKAG